MDLKETKCIVYIIQGGFTVGGVTYTGTLVGRNVVDESQITSSEGSKLVIIYKT